MNYYDQLKKLRTPELRRELEAVKDRVLKIQEMLLKRKGELK